MVTTAFLLFTVSTLAAQVNATPTNEVNHDLCKGKTHCFKKPADYPQEEIDRLLAQSDLHHLHRIKRETQLAFRKSNGKDECVEESTVGRLYEGTDTNNVTRVIVQSGFFAQIVPKITCKTNQTCLADLHDDRFRCKSIITRINLTMYNIGKVESAPFGLITGCFCAKHIPTDGH